ncbi:AAA family ATPase [Peptostreptococcus stomatis]
MQYKIVDLRVKNFKCFDDKKYYEFCIDYDKSPVVLSGPNGFGKTTFFDAVELIFSKNITRFDKEIEKKNTNLGKNILLNQANQDGYVVLTLKRGENEFLTLFAKILNSNHKIDVENSIYYGYSSKYICTEELDGVILGYNNWKNVIDSETLIRYRIKNFNVYYYVSQAESVHFLKRTISDRKNAMDVLLNTGFIEERKKLVSNLIGSRNKTSGHLINDEIISLDNKIKNLATKLKTLLKTNTNTQTGVEKIENIDLGLYEKDSDLYFWDNSNIVELDTYSIKKGIYSLSSIISFLENEIDYRNYQWNENILKIIDGNSIVDYVNYRDYIVNDSVSIKKIEQQLEKWDSMIQIYNSTLLYRQDSLDAANYKEQDAVMLKKLVPELYEYDFSLIKNISNEIVNLRENLSINQKAIDKLTSARNALKNAKNEYDEKGTRCPFCNTEFNDLRLLNEGFEEVGKLLKSESGNLGERIVLKNNELVDAIEEVKEILRPYVYGLDGNSINLIIKKKASLKGFASDHGRVANVDELVKYLVAIEYSSEKEEDNLVLDIKRTLSGMIKMIQNEKFNTLYDKYGYVDVEKRYGKFINEMKGQVSLEMLKRKVLYLEKLNYEKENTEINEIKQEMKKLILRKEKVTKVRQRLNDLSKLYDNKIEEYKNITLKKLRVPLLIYTGKILQDYQNGLGVFVSRDEMRFVSNGDAKHDILNTFSSGQLSGFVLAFLFAMNKQYIKPSSDDIGFILIDDPVQTMDDVNISSLIEVLRNDFADKQIILSTHEIDKENYILYKFYKYNKIGQSFNVKEKIYG